MDILTIKLTFKDDCNSDWKIGIGYLRDMNHPI